MKATLIEKLIVQIVGFAQGVILARLLCPEDFGLAAMLGIFLGTGACLAESGLGTAFVVYGGDAKRVRRWNVGVAMGIYLILAIAAPWIAAWYGQPILRELMWVMGISLIINAASVSLIANLQRAKKFIEIAIANSAAVVVSSMVGVGMAWKGCGVWSITGVGLAYAIIRLIVLNASRKRALSVECRMRSDEFGDLLKYGLKLMVSGLVHSVYFNAYNMVIGKMVNPAAVALFNRGQRWSVFPGNMVNEATARVALPSLAKGETSVEVIGMNVEWWIINILLLWPGLTVLWIWAPQIVGYILGSQWLDCVPYLRILLIGQFFTPISNIALQKIRASGRAGDILRTDAIKKPIGIASLVVGAMFGVVGFCWAKVVDDIVEAVVDLAYARKV